MGVKDGFRAPEREMPLSEVTQRGPGRDREPGLVRNVHPRATAGPLGARTAPSVLCPRMEADHMGTVEKLLGQMEAVSGCVEDEGR